MVIYGTVCNAAASGEKQLTIYNTIIVHIQEK